MSQAPRNPSDSFAGPSRPSVVGSQAASSSQTHMATKKKKHRGGRKHRRPRRKSFATLPEDEGGSVQGGDRESAARSSGAFYMQGRRESNESLDSQGLLDHRSYPFGSRPRRPSVLGTSYQLASQQGERDSQSRRRTQSGRRDSDRDRDADDGRSADEAEPLLTGSLLREAGQRKNYGSSEGRPRFERRGSSKSSNWRSNVPTTPSGDKYNVNYPPSMPPSPRLGASVVNFGDEMMREELHAVLSQPSSLIEAGDDPLHGSSPLQRRHTIALQAEDDVCYPQEGLSEIADEDTQPSQEQRARRTRRRRDRWPDMSVLEDWSVFEKEIIDRNEERRIKKITEPQLINGRLRPTQKGWFKAEEDAPYRFTYFNEELQSTIHSQTISELVQPDCSFRELFIPDPPVLSDYSDDSEEEPTQPSRMSARGSVRGSELGNGFNTSTRQPSIATMNKGPDENGRDMSRPLSPRQQPAGSTDTSRLQSGDATPVGPGVRSPPTVVDARSPEPYSQKPLRYGDRPVWWLDVMSPTADEMKVIQKTFGIHPLTSEDIMLQEQREKVELFRHYYFVSYRSFDQDEESDKHLDPVNIYVVVFREGIISFHFDHTPHPANVRRRIRQLKDYIVLSADWISYAIIDDITDVFGPLVQHIQEEVDDIEDAILSLNAQSQAQAQRRKDDGDEKSVAPTRAVEQDDGDMLHRIGQCRKKATELLRLLGNKADVIKGFAKRCNEHYEVAPRSEIGLYLGDIQDHIVTMTGNLMHADKTLGVSSNTYLAQINILMNKRAEQTNDMLNKLTVLGTIVLPMNIITGLWGMNVWVPGQEYEDSLTWFWGITAGLVAFGAACYLTATRVYKIA
ncbi:metal ion transporter C17A12.14 [Seiridium cupressi]